MTTLDEARAIWAQQKGKFAPKIKTRVVYQGDGRGYAASNLIVPEKPDLIYVRERLNSKHFFPVQRGAAVKPAFNIPVLIGKDPYDSHADDIVLREHMGAWQYSNSASVIGGVGPHHTQHEWGGGDEVFVSANQFKPGLARPTNPRSMQVSILPFIHYYETWQQFAEEDTIDLSIYLPTTGQRLVTIAIDPGANSIVYRPGAQQATNLTWANMIEGGDGALANLPPPSGDEIPVCVVLLEPETTKIDWNPNGIYNLFSVRMYLNNALKRISDRVSQVEGYLGFSPNLATTGAANSSADEFPAAIDGGVF